MAAIFHEAYWKFLTVQSLYDFFVPVLKWLISFITGDEFLCVSAWLSSWPSLCVWFNSRSASVEKFKTEVVTGTPEISVYHDRRRIKIDGPWLCLLGHTITSMTDSFLCRFPFFKRRVWTPTHNLWWFNVSETRVRQVASGHGRECATQLDLFNDFTVLLIEHIPTSSYPPLSGQDVVLVLQLFVGRKWLPPCHHRAQCVLHPP